MVVHPALPDKRVYLEIFGVSCKKIPQQRKGKVKSEKVGNELSLKDNNLN